MSTAGRGCTSTSSSDTYANVVDLEVVCTGAEREGAIAIPERDRRFPAANPALHILSADIAMAAAVRRGRAGALAHLVRQHGRPLSKLLYDVPHVVTAHSLEPQRPWKAEQLGGGYRLSSWAERTAYRGPMPSWRSARAWRGRHGRRTPASTPTGSTSSTTASTRTSTSPTGNRRRRRARRRPRRPYVTFVGRITRQKGVPHLLRPALQVDPRVQLVLLAGAADTPELKAETDEAIARAAVGPRRGVRRQRDAAARERAAGALPCAGVRVPVGLRAAGHRQPRGDGLRDRRGGQRRRRHPGSRRRRRDRSAGRLHARRPSRLRGGDRGARSTDSCADPARAEAMGRAGRQRAVTSSTGRRSPTRR